MNVFTLLGKGNFEVYRICLNSFVQNYKEDFALFAISDGTLGEAEKQALQKLPRTQIVPEGYKQAEIQTLLKRHPLLEEYHRKWPYFKKLVDMPIIAGGEFAFLDSDIFFFGPFEGLFEHFPIFNLMAEEVAVSPGLRDLLFCWQTLHGNTNAGILQGTLPNYSRLERFLAGYRDSKEQILEQIAWQLCWGQDPIWLVKLSSVRISKRHEDLPADLSHKLPIAYHMTAHRKQFVKDIAALALPANSPTRKVKKVLQQPHLAVADAALKVWRRMIGWA